MRLRTSPYYWPSGVTSGLREFVDGYVTYRRVEHGNRCLFQEPYVHNCDACFSPDGVILPCRLLSFDPGATWGRSTDIVHTLGYFLNTVSLEAAVRTSNHS